MQIKLVIVFFLCMLLMCQCQSTTCISLLCNDPNVDIYVEDEYVGKNLVQYTLPTQLRSIQVECKKMAKAYLSAIYTLNVNLRTDYMISMC